MLTYGEVRDFLVARTKVVELINESGGRVAVCPEYQCRIMTSTTGGVNGPSYGWVNRAFIERGERNRQFNNYGGEDRFWLGPEGGQYSLWFAEGAEQTPQNWFTPPALNEGGFDQVSKDQDPFYIFRRRLQLQNAAKTRFDLEVTRRIQLLSAHHFGKIFGSEAQDLLEATKTRMVGFQSINTLTNRGAAMSREQGLTSIWSLGMFPPGPKTVVVVPYQSGAESALGPVVKSDYFREIPADRLQVRDDAVFFRVDGQYQSKIGTSPRRCKPMAGAIDLEAGLLTLVHFSMPSDPSQFSYLNNAWGASQKDPYDGDVFNSYNDGPPAPGKPSLGGFYELESLSPAVELPQGKALTHVHSTFHLEGPPDVLVQFAKVALGVDVSALK